MSKTENSKYLKIAMLGHKRIPSREGGIEVVVEELATRMVKYGHEVVCYNRRGHHISGKEFDLVEIKDNYKGIKLKTVFTLNYKGLAAITSSIIATLKCAFSKYDVIHFHAEGTCVMLWLPKILNKRCIVTVHGLDHQRNKWGVLGKTYIKLGEKVAVRYADEIIVLSENVKKYFMDTYKRETTFIPNGINRPIVKRAELITKEYGILKDSYILYLGRIVPEKGISYLIESFKKVNTKKCLIIAGGASDTGSFMIELKEEAKGDDRIFFTGFVQGRTLEELYSNAYIYILPSDLEGMPLSLLEAMSYSNCCIVSNIPECTEVVEDKAIWFKKSDVNDLTEKIQMLCDDKTLVEKYKSESSEFISFKYSWDAVVNETLNLYKK